MGKPLDPDYWKKWRAAHPAYREREKARSRLSKHHGDRVGQRARARERLLRSRADLGWVETSHPLLDAATAIVVRYVRPDRRTVLFDPLYEDAVMTAVLAILEGADPAEATSCFLRAERSRRYREAPLLEERGP